MSLYVIVAHDHPGMSGVRMEKLKAHLAHIEATMETLAVAGPMRDADGQIVGSLLVVHADSEAGARALLESDPYYNAGIWASIEVRAFHAAAGGWIGGKGW